MNYPTAIVAVALVIALPVEAEPPGEADFAWFVGQAVCLDCHGTTGPAAACSLEPIPRHGRAYQLLLRPEARSVAALSGIAESPIESRICLGCHATGAEEGPRWAAPGFRLEAGVQCEACHGPGSVHARDRRNGANTVGRSVPEALRRGDRESCTACHRERPSHREVFEGGFRLTPSDERYKTPINLAVSPDGAWLYVVGERSDSVIVVDTARGAPVGEVRVGRRPHDVAVTRDGDLLYVTNRLSGTLSVVDARRLRVLREIAVGGEPHGVLVDSEGGRAYVLCSAQDAVAIVNTRTLAVENRLAAGRRPWSLAPGPDGRTCYVTSTQPAPARFRESSHSEITLLDLENGRVHQRLRVSDANLLQGIGSAAGGDVTLFTLMRTKNLVPMTRLAQGWTITNGLGVIWPDGRIDQVLLDEPNAFFADPNDVAVSPDRRLALITSGGNDEVAVVDVERLRETVLTHDDRERAETLPNELGASARFVIKRLRVGANPRGVAFAPDGTRAYVANALADSVTVIDTLGLTVTATIDLGGPAEATELRRGERLFHSAANAFGRQFSCRSCHPDGHLNGLAFDIEADGIGLHPVDNRTLRGILDTAPFKWEGTNPTLARQCGPRLAVFFTRLPPLAPDDLTALVRYTCTIERPPNPYHDPRGLTAAQRRGKAIFERTIANDGSPLAPAQQCAACHSGVYKTNGQRAAVASTMWLDAWVDVDPADWFEADEFGELGSYYFIDAGIPSREFDVPHLTDIYNGGPYLHNGAAATLEEIWTRFNIVERHGKTNDLTRRQFNDLIAYLKSL
ncbi:MAG: beta-propeller fold lactonase family protein [Planctomycetes bacterium]|nr:beta-propeller fold lactonase family protein [Planctomycetota bacterium]